jgi:hypothetical protein
MEEDDVDSRWANKEVAVTWRGPQREEKKLS